MKKLIKILLNKSCLDSVKYIANTDDDEVLVTKDEARTLFFDFVSEDEMNNVDYVLFGLTKG